jgi:hypothetical protein
MALRLVATRSKCHLIFPVKNFRNCIDLQKLNASTMSQDFMKNLSALMMSKKPVKGFEKFYKEKKNVSSKKPAAAAEEDKKETPEPQKEPPSKSASESFKKDFQFKFQIPSTGGGKGSSSG